MIVCTKSSVKIIQKNILYIEVKKNEEFNLNDYNEVKLASIKLTTGKPVYNLIHLGDNTIPDRAAREACTANIGFGWIKAEALVVYSLGQRIIARQLLKTKKKHMPVRLFKNPEKAMVWLETIRDQLDGTNA